MNRIERVKAAIHFQKPDRVPVYKSGLGDVLPMVMMPSKNWQPGHTADEQGLFPFHYDDMVIKFGLWRWKKPAWAKTPEFKNWLKIPREEIDDFGVTWIREGRNESMGHPGKPPLTDWADYEKYIARYSPDAYDKTRYTFFTRLSKLVGRNRYRMCLTGFQGPFTMASAIRGFTPFMMDHRKNPDKLKKLLAHLTSYYANAMRAWVKYGANPHGFLLVDDLGDQSSSFLSPDMFSKFYEPVFKTLIDTAHELGCELHLHSCGKIDKIMPIFIDWGLDAFEFDAPRMIGYEDLAPFRGKIMMWGDIDIQRIYTTGTPEECEQEVAIMIEKMGTNDGGFGAYFYPQTYHINVPKANIRAFARGLRKYGTYKR